jgi:uncharacterized membrane protein
MNTYDGLVNDYLRAVEQALDGVPAGRRDQVLADLSDHIAAKLAETRAEAGQTADGAQAGAPGAAEVRSVLDLLGEPEELAAELEAAERSAAETAGSAAPIEINPGRRVGALIWVLATIAMVSLLCVGVVLAGVFLFFTSR